MRRWKHFCCGNYSCASVRLMNAAEKIAATYLRLNGFLLAPRFTVFGGGQHNHIDLVGLRGPGSNEVVNGHRLPTNDAFFDAIPNHVCADPRNRALGMIAEVRTNDRRDQPTVDQMRYVAGFLGVGTIIPIAFFESRQAPEWTDDGMRIGMIYALDWIASRITWMNENNGRLTKTGSWTLSEDALADLLVLHRYGSFQRLLADDDD